MMDELQEISENLDEYILRRAGNVDEVDMIAQRLRNTLSKHAEPEPVKFVVSVGELKASNGTTYVVSINHPSRPKDAEPWDYDGRIEIMSLSTEEHAELMAEEVRAVLNKTPLYYRPTLGLSMGDYCLATRWSDEDPADPWAIGFICAIMIKETETLYKLRGDRVPDRWFKHCRRISEDEAKAKLSVIENSFG